VNETHRFASVSGCCRRHEKRSFVLWESPLVLIAWLDGLVAIRRVVASLWFEQHRSVRPFTISAAAAVAVAVAAVAVA
jgi:hypothetical protein